MALGSGEVGRVVLVGLIAEGVKVIEPRVEGGIAGGGAGVLAVDGVKGSA